jgi:hypothetical protein
MGEAAESACHELLLRLAGRLPDRQLWRFRDWLAAGALPELSHVLPLTLLRERIGLVEDEFRLVDTALRGYGADVGLLSSIGELYDLPEPDFAFTEHYPDAVSRAGVGHNSLGDQLAVLLAALLRGRVSVGEVRSTWRRPRHPAGKGVVEVRRVLLVTATSDQAALAGELQRVQRAVGEPDPCVEVLPPNFVPMAYHRAGLAASELLCIGAEDQYGQLVHGAR